MNSFSSGLLTGIAFCSLAAIAAGVFLYKRFVRLERRAQQAERLAELGTLTGGLAHEIKNPLSTVQLNLQLLREDLPEGTGSTRLVSRLDTVTKETSRLREILDDFLRYAGRIELDRKPVELNGLLDELVDFFSPQAQLQRVQLRRKLDAPKVLASVDSKLIKQAVLNLMLNAMQAMPNGGEMILAASNDTDRAMIDIIDTGSGIPPETQAKIFQAYYSTKRGGTGLGLAMAKRIAEEHGGKLSVTSEMGKGSNFRLELPMNL